MPLKGDTIHTCVCVCIYILECYTIMIDIKFLLEVLRASEEKLSYLKESVAIGRVLTGIKQS